MIVSLGMVVWTIWAKFLSAIICRSKSVKPELERFGFLLMPFHVSSHFFFPREQLEKRKGIKFIKYDTMMICILYYKELFVFH